MRATMHLIRDMDSLKQAVSRGLRFSRTKCGSAVLLENLTLEVSDGVDCGACIALSKKESAQELAPRAPISIDQIDLSDFESIGSIDRDDAAPQRTMLPPYPEPDSPSPVELASRLGKDPATDPKGKLGNLPVDVRTVFLESERAPADMILGMVGSLPPAAPLLSTIYRICHRLAWLEWLNGRSDDASEE